MKLSIYVAMCEVLWVLAFILLLSFKLTANTGGMFAWNLVCSQFIEFTVYSAFLQDSKINIAYSYLLAMCSIYL